MSDEEDYMSDNFLAKCVPTDVRPGLKRTHETQREHEIMKKKSENDGGADDYKRTKQSKSELEAEKREEGLQTSLDSSNKGFALLAKMGYKAGDSLGKSNTGIVEPVGIALKTNRGGLGREAAVQQIKAAKAKMRALKKAGHSSANSMSTEDFRANMSKKLKVKRLEGDLFRSQKACRQLDMAKEFKPVEKWFWPATIQAEPVENNEPTNLQKIIENEEQQQPEENEEDEEEIEFPPEEMLIMLTDYLRTEHLYCTWCGITFTDLEDLSKSCPGKTRDDHED